MRSRQERIDHALSAIADGRISEAEADYFLRTELGTTLADARNMNARGMSFDAIKSLTTGDAFATTPPVTPASPVPKTIPILIAIFFTVAIVSLSLYMDGSPTGFVVLDIPHQNYSAGTITIDRLILGLNVSGTLYGDGDASIWLDTPVGTLLVGTLSSDIGTPQTDKSAYAPGDQITVLHAPTDATYYFDDGVASSAVTPPLVADINGTLLIVANVSNELITYRLPIIVGEAVRAIGFSELCVDTCTLNATNGTLRIETTGTAQVYFTSVDIAVPETNQAPMLVFIIDPVIVENTTSINLSQHFADPDGTQLLYDTGSSDLVDARIDGDLLIMTPIASGTGQLMIYASDLVELVPAMIDITSIAAAAPPVIEPPVDNTTLNNTEQNSTINITDNTTDVGVENTTTLNDTNITVNPDANTTALPLNMTLDCTNPDPNARPIDCLNLNATKYFEEEILLEDESRVVVARMTEIGNLLILGRVIKNDAQGIAGAGDFNIGYKDGDFNYIKTIWIDKTTGDLHLRGQLYEENNNLVPPQGSYAISNRRGIYLAYADQTTGDLYVRGNIIPFRERLQ